VIVPQAQHPPVAGPATLDLEPLAGVPDVRAEWSALAAAAGNVFLTPEWSEAWLALGAECEPRLFAGRRADGSLAAIVPLVLTRGRFVRKLRLLGFGAANELGPVAAPADAEPAARALRGAADAIRAEWDVFLAENLAGRGWADRLGCVTVAAEGGPVVRGPWESWDAYLASRSRDFRQELRRKERRLESRGMRLWTVSTEAELDGALDVLFALHRAYWREHASPWFAGLEPFHRAFAAAALAEDWLRLHVLELEGRPAALYLGFRFGEAEFAYQFGRDPAYERDSVGAVIAGHAIRTSIEEGAAEFRLGPGSQGYKTRLATDDPGLETVGRAQGLRGRAALYAAGRRAR
jgi:CelD/BcsL family acetyltransferase involved in cellulose biosynthesis